MVKNKRKQSIEVIKASEDFSKVEKYNNINNAVFFSGVSYGKIYNAVKNKTSNLIDGFYWFTKSTFDAIKTLW